MPPSGPAFARPTRSLVGSGVVACCGLLIEGAMGDWSAVYLRDALAAAPGPAASGLPAFSLAMAASRLAGDALTHRLGPGRLVCLGALLAAGRLVLALLGGWLPLAVAGFTCVGLGLGAAFPVVVSAAAREGSQPLATAIAAVTTAGYLGLLAGPPLIGLAAQAVTLRGGLGILALLGALVASLAGTTAGARPHVSPTGGPR